MKRSIAVCALVLAAIPLTARAEGRYVLYADEDRSSCTLVDREAGIVKVHMFAEGIRNLIVTEFAAPIPDCWEGAVWIEDVVAHELWLVSTQDEVGLSVFVGTPGKGNCWNSIAPDPVYIGYISIQTQGLAKPCCVYPILPGASADGPQPAAAVCGGPDGVQAVPVVTQSAVINGDETCACGSLQTLPVEETSWGRVKALYK